MIEFADSTLSLLRTVLQNVMKEQLVSIASS